MADDDDAGEVDILGGGETIGGKDIVVGVRVAPGPVSVAAILDLGDRVAARMQGGSE